MYSELQTWTWGSVSVEQHIGELKQYQVRNELENVDVEVLTRKNILC